MSVPLLSIITATGSGNPYDNNNNNKYIKREWYMFNRMTTLRDVQLDVGLYCSQISTFSTHPDLIDLLLNITMNVIHSFNHQ